MEGIRQAVTRLTLDMSIPDVQKSFSCTKGDVNRRLEITLTDGKNPFEIPNKWTAFLCGTKPDETELYNGCVVDRGKIIYDFASGAEIATCVGTFGIQFDIFDENGFPTASPKVWVHVMDSVRTVASNDQFTALGDLIGTINAVQVDVDELAEDVRSGFDDVDVRIGGIQSDVNMKLDKPNNQPYVGKVLKVESVLDDGTFTCRWADDVSNGTTVSVNGEEVANISFDEDPQQQIRRKIEKPNNEPLAGKILKVASVNDNGAFECAWEDDETVETYTNTSAPVKTVGGISPSTFPNGFDNKSFSDIMDAMFYPYTKPVINRLIFTPDAGVKKKGQEIRVTYVSVFFAKNSENIVRIEVYNGNNLTKSVDQTFTESSTFGFSYRDVMDGNTNTTFSVRVIDETGGYDESYVTYTFVDPYYFAVLNDGDEISEDNITAGEEKIETKGTKVYSFTTAYNQFPAIAYPADYGELSSIQDANGFSQVWSRTTLTISGVEYYVYYGSSAAAENFKYTFNY